MSETKMHLQPSSSANDNNKQSQKPDCPLKLVVVTFWNY